MIQPDHEVPLVPQHPQQHVAGVERHVDGGHPDVPERYPGPPHVRLHLGADGVVGNLLAHHAAAQRVAAGVQIADEGLVILTRIATLF